MRTKAYRAHCYPVVVTLIMMTSIITACSEDGDTNYVTQTSDDPFTSVCSGNNSDAICSEDLDNDGLSYQTELAGWEVLPDRYGYGSESFNAYSVTSDPDNSDTDSDGLSDQEEYFQKTDPRLADTDGDGLNDYEEVYRWLTSPLSVDTDGDARGEDSSLPPNSQLFDGNELAIGANNLYRTSPTLADTDGDGRSDFEEVDHPSRSPLIADIPQLDIEIVDAVDVRLDVEYSEEQGQSREYGSEITESESHTYGSHNEWTLSAGFEVGTEVEAKAGVLQWGGSKWTGKITGGFEASWGFSNEHSKGLQQAYSDYTTDARTRTETAASGSMSTGVVIKNTGNITYNLSQIGLTVRQLQTSSDTDELPAFKTIATLSPPIEGSITLAPGASTPVIQVQAEQVNASRVKELLRRPMSLIIESAYYELENSDGLNFDFLEEVTASRTASVLIDFGDGYSRKYRIATNVNRQADSTLAGISLGEVMADVLTIGYTTVSLSELYSAAETDELVLNSVWNANTDSYLKTNEIPERGFWAVVVRSPRLSTEVTDFDDIVLFGGEEILLTYILDDDGDGLYSFEEQYYGTADSQENIEAVVGDDATDSDDDGLSDKIEVRDDNCQDPNNEEASCGWVVILNDGTRYAVTSDPGSADQDADGLNDTEEKILGTDPSIPDTDRDGLRDKDDPYPLSAARVFYVDQDASGTGEASSWDNAATDLGIIIPLARMLNSDDDGDNDVSEIWVAQGIYRPDETFQSPGNSFQLLDKLGIYGGFTGNESKRDQRNSDPIFNGTTLSCDYDQNDQPDQLATLTDNCTSVVVSINNDSAAVLDGFTITGGHADGRNGISWGAGVRVVQGGPTLRRLFFKSNHSQSFFRGAGLDAYSTTGMTLSDSIFEDHHMYDANNVPVALFYGSAASHNGGSDPDLLINRCEFINNDYAIMTDVNGSSTLSLRIEESYFRDNWIEFTGTGKLGSAISFLGGGGVHHIDRSTFENSAVGVTSSNSDVLITQSVFLNNDLGLVQMGSRRMTVINSTVIGGAIGMNSWNTKSLVQNSIFWSDDTDYILTNSPNDITWKHSCLNEDPSFVNLTLGNLRLTEYSLCLDRGNNYVDFNSLLPSYQPMPTTDLDGKLRIIDGDGDGRATVDAGAYEFQ